MNINVYQYREQGLPNVYKKLTYTFYLYYFLYIIKNYFDKSYEFSIPIKHFYAKILILLYYL